jgi:hypothetical protein
MAAPRSRQHDDAPEDVPDEAYAAFVSSPVEQPPPVSDDEPPPVSNDVPATDSSLVPLTVSPSVAQALAELVAQLRTDRHLYQAVRLALGKCQRNYRRGPVTAVLDALVGEQGT